MKKRISGMCVKIGRYAAREAEKEVKALLKHYRIKPARIKTTARKVAVYGMKMAREMQNIAMKEMKAVMKMQKKKKK